MTGMNVSSPSPGSSSLERAPISSLEIDRSCRLPVLFFFGSASIWLVLGSILALISSLKLSLPDFLSHTAWLGFGRLRPASLDALVYGFALQAALGTMLWMIARLGRALLYGSLIITTAGALWNLGVTVGVIAILAGQSTGYEWLEFPRYASSFLFVSYVLIGTCGMITFCLRQEMELYPSAWFLFAALLWFPWIYSTAQLLLILFPVRGVVQAVVNSWFAHNLLRFWLSAVGLATLFYFVPKVLDRPLYSRWLAFLAFWLFAFLGGWGGLSAGMPVPKWYTAVSSFATFMLIVPVIATATNFYLTANGRLQAAPANLSWKFVVFGSIAYILAGALDGVAALRPVSRFILFTELTDGLLYLGLFGFFGMAMFGAMYYIVPRLAEESWASSTLVQVHYWASAVGIGLCVIAFCIGGILQGVAMNDPSIPFLDVVRRMFPFLTVTSLGFAAISVGSAALLMNLSWTLARWGVRTFCRVDDVFAPEIKISAGATQ